jgi:hypothetical protein
MKNGRKEYKRSYTNDTPINDATKYINSSYTINHVVLNLSIYSVVIIILIFIIAVNGLFISFVFAEQQKNTNTTSTIITSVTQNLLTVVSFLIGTSSFILGLSLQNISKSEPNSVINKYFSVLILALVVPSIIIIVYGIFLVGSTIEPGDIHYLLLLLSLFVPAGVILFLVGKLRLLSKTNT